MKQLGYSVLDPKRYSLFAGALASNRVEPRHPPWAEVQPGVPSDRREGSGLRCSVWQ